MGLSGEARCFALRHGFLGRVHAYALPTAPQIVRRSKLRPVDGLSDTCGTGRGSPPQKVNHLPRTHYMHPDFVLETAWNDLGSCLPSISRFEHVGPHAGMQGLHPG